MTTHFHRGYLRSTFCSGPCGPACGQWRKIGHRCVPRLRDALTREDDARGEDKDLGVKQQTPMVDVPNVEGQSLIPPYGVPAVDDRPPCHPWQNVVPPALLLSVSLQIHRQEGAGSDQAQLASNDVQELRQFVDARRAKELAETGQSLLVGEKLTIQPTRFLHRSQLDDFECLFVEAHARLTKENRGTHRGANGNGREAKDGGCCHQEARSDGPIDHLLHDETPAALLHRL